MTDEPPALAFSAAGGGDKQFREANRGESKRCQVGWRRLPAPLRVDALAGVAHAQRKVISVIVENEKARSADDVTILREFDAHPPDIYHQIKYHVDQRGSYSEAVLIHREGNERRLLQKWFRSWETLLSSTARL